MGAGEVRDAHHIHDENEQGGCQDSCGNPDGSWRVWLRLLRNQFPAVEGWHWFCFPVNEYTVPNMALIKTNEACGRANTACAAPPATWSGAPAVMATCYGSDCTAAGILNTTGVIPVA